MRGARQSIQTIPPTFVHKYTRAYTTHPLPEGEDQVVIRGAVSRLDLGVFLFGTCASRWWRFCGAAGYLGSRSLVCAYGFYFGAPGEFRLMDHMALSSDGNVQDL